MRLKIAIDRNLSVEWSKIDGDVKQLKKDHLLLISYPNRDGQARYSWITKKQKASKLF